MALAATSSLRAADAPAELSVVPAYANIPGGIADSTGGVAYVASASDGIIAIDMANGHPMWESKEAVHPMALDGSRLIAQAPRGQSKVNTIDLVFMDAATGHVLMQPQQIALPDWISVEGGIGLKYSSTTAVDGHDMIISWWAERQFAGGVPPNPEAIAAAHKIESGTVRVDLESGQSVVKVDDAPQQLKLPRSKPYYDVADKRLSSTDSPEKLPGGVQIIHRILDARDSRTGKPLWRQEIAGDIILPPNAAATAERLSKQPQPQLQQPERR